MSERLSRFDVNLLRPDTVAVLLDFDGTLVQIADRPSAVVVLPRTKDTLAALHDSLDGAFAIISGRSVADIDRFLAPNRFAVAGVHGLERRDSDGTFHLGDFDPTALATVSRELREAIAGQPELLLEPKPGSVALHFRQRPELVQFCHDAAQEVCARHEDARLLAGKMVVEIKLGGRTKADAVRAFMAESPFRGRSPIYAGDDVTDEDGFLAARELGGTSIKIGRGHSIADYRVQDIDGFLDWLDALAGRLAGTKRAATRRAESP